MSGAFFQKVEIVWCSSSAAVVGTTVCVRSNSWSSNSGGYLCVEWCVELCVAQCRCVELSCRDTQSDVCGIKRDGVRR